MAKDDFDWALSKYKQALELVKLAHKAEISTLNCLQGICDHRNKTVKHCGDGGSYYDRATYWDEYYCPDCQLKQTHETGRGGYG